MRGSGTAATETREVERFVNVRVEGAADLVISIGEPQSVVVETDDNLLDLLDTDVRGDTLTIEFRDRVRPRVDVEVTMTVASLEGIRVDGAADIDIKGMAGGELAITINGAATVRADGVADGVEIDVSGAGEVKLFELVAADVDVSISGSGDAEVTATQRLSASLTGSGQLVYDGDPEDVDTSITGAGKIERR